MRAVQRHGAVAEISARRTGCRCWRAATLKCTNRAASISSSWKLLEPQGAGALQLAFEQLKRKLEAEGLFAAERKRPLPKLPSRIGIVTSPAGAVIRDILHVLERGFAGLHIRVFPAQVQGEGARGADLPRDSNTFSAGQWADVVIVARGGGSLEDLWTFNEEAVARAIAVLHAFR